MESRWRWNIAFYGLIAGPEELCARLLPLNPDHQGFAVRRNDAPYVAVYEADGDQVPTFQYFWGAIFAPFPGGLDVEPDQM